MRRILVPLLSLLVALLAMVGAAHAQERVLDYHADIAIAVDGSMDVTERIRVWAEGTQIVHGIYRDFPTDYRDTHRNRVRIGFDVLDATRDGVAEEWHGERRANGVRIKLGSAATVVSPGDHEYMLRYRVTREIGFFADHDELYWNVNGTGWGFAVERIGATVRLPVGVGVDRLRAYGYTGTQDSREQSLDVTLRDDGADYTATRPLGPSENLSIVLEFPRHIVNAPSTAQKWRWLLADNHNLLYGLGGLIVLWLYYLFAWNKHGRDPARGPLVAEYEPPDGDSAAALRFVRRMGYDNTCFTAGILGLAAKGGLTIERRHDDKWLIRRHDGVDGGRLAAAERALHAALFAAGDELLFEPKQHARVQSASAAFRSALKADFEKKYFRTNRAQLLPGLAITVLTVLLASAGGSEGTVFMLLWLAGWSVGVAFLIASALQAGRGDGKGAGGLWFMAAVFSLFEIVGLGALGMLAGFAVVPIFLLLIGTNIAFHQWMKAPTQLGAKLLDRIDGFRWYLGVAEKQELDARYRPESRPELFAAYLPYALALGVGNAWAQRFADALTPTQMQAARPEWYVGGSDGFEAAGFAGFSRDLSSGLGGAIASSSVAPGSSSGSGGGSGGGGGGGGGGGW